MNGSKDERKKDPSIWRGIRKSIYIIKLCILHLIEQNKNFVQLRGVILGVFDPQAVNDPLEAWFSAF